MMTAILASAGALAVVAQPPSPLPRLGVRGGRFIEVGSGAEFRPRGFNYIRLRTVERNGQKHLWHDTFNPVDYSPGRAEALFADLEARSFNLVRVFIDHETGPGTIASADATELSPGYMAGFFDFLRRATAHRVYVIPCFCYLPARADYHALVGPAPPQVGGHNLTYLNPGHVRAKAAYMADFATAIKAHDPSLLPTVFAYEIENESHFIATAPPFSLTEGEMEFGGNRYDLSSEEELQRLADDAIVLACDTFTDAVRAVDPEAMVSANVFTFRAVGRSGPAHLRQDESRDPRFPARPLALARSKIAYLDVHFYPMDETTLDKDFASIELPEVKEVCAARGMPMIVGEIGAFRFRYETLPEAARAMTQSLLRLYREGFAGYLYWTYDSQEQDDALWHAKAGKGEIIEALAGLVGTEPGGRG